MELAIKGLQGLEKQLGEMLLDNVSKPPYERMYHIHDFTRLLKELSGDTEEELMAPFVLIVRDIAGDYAAEVAYHAITHMKEYPYSAGYYRRPFRTAKPELHRSRILSVITGILILTKSGFTIEGYLTTPDVKASSRSVCHMLAYELDRNNQEVLTALREIMYGDNQTVLLDRDMILGIMRSHNRDAYRMLGELFIAARLQEGLRQGIVEAMDEGTPEAFLYFLDIIREQGYIRFSSIVRALDVWTGLALEAAQARVTKQCLEYIHSCLKEEPLRREWSASPDVHKLFAALWAAAFLEETNVVPLIEELLDRGAVYHKITALYFLAQSQNKELCSELAARHLEQDEPELQALILANYNRVCSYNWTHHEGQQVYNVSIVRTPELEATEERERQFRVLRRIVDRMPREAKTYSSKVFDWIQWSQSADMVVERMMYLTAYDFDNERVAELIALQDKMSPELRGKLMSYFLKDLQDKRQRAFLIGGLTDKSMTNRENALRLVSKISLHPREVEAVEELLKLRTGSIRQGAMGVLMGLPLEQWEGSASRLLQSKSELQRAAALEMLCEKKEDTKQEVPSYTIHNLASLIKTPSEKEKLLLGRLNEQVDAVGFHNGFGLFDPSAAPIPRECKDEEGYSISEWLLQLSMDRMKAFLSGLSDLVHEYRDYEYEVETSYSGRQSHLLGTKLERSWERGDERRRLGLEGYPLTEVWKAYMDKSGLSTEDLLRLNFYLASEHWIKFYTNKLNSWERSRYTFMGEWGKPFLDELYPMELVLAVLEFAHQLPYERQVHQLVLSYLWECPDSEIFPVCMKNLVHVMGRIERHTEGALSGVSMLLVPSYGWTKSHIQGDEDYKMWFQVHWNLDIMTNFENYSMNTEELAKACELGLLEEQEIYQELLGRKHRSGHHLQAITRRARNQEPSYSALLPYRDRIVALLVDLELHRGDLPTDGSELAMCIRHFEGMEHFVSILTRLEKDAFVRGYCYGGKTKKEALSQLLRVCHPRADEDEVRLRELLASTSTKISDKRLLEAAMYAPQWLDIIAKYLQWAGLRSAAWYFHAHINETFSPEKETIVAHYSPISANDFNDGAFDVDWFRNAYEKLGEKRFSLLYDCARYISAGSNHRRSQLFADAVLGKLQLEEMRSAIETKRNKDHLLCYSLIPIRNERDVLERYEAISRFLKESKQFGAQRRVSEAKAAGIALENLARSAGYRDVIRLKWEMEARKIEEVRRDMDPHELIEGEGITVRLAIDEDGRAELEASKNGKPLKSLPSKYNKHPYAVELKEKVSELRDQYKRAKAELERSMESGSSFTGRELKRLLGNPVIAPLVQSLVFLTGNKLGFLQMDGLQGPAGVCHEFEDEAELLIAHPIHLFDSGQWSAFQRNVFDRQLRQPFKQVFRELYRPHEDERQSGKVSRRYAGHQIQPKKAAALLRSRMWTASYEEGLQKVFYKENIIAQVYAMADWFSPSDIEAPALETVMFFDRRTYESLDLTEVPPIIFSEVMRDVDLVVSVAHAGGVDPEASLTTIECRSALVGESLRLLKLANVHLEGNYARITGSLGEYGVHLGSGSVYKQAAGAVYIVPVHSQHRGRIFLPFLDEDPKTAEILSKIVLLAQDHKIKDPHILEQLKSS